MESMQSWFGLKDNHRDFTIENDVDARLFFARVELNEQLMAIVRKSFRTGNPPKFILYGDWGCGKTHTMRHIQHVLETQSEFPSKVVFVELPDIEKKSTFQVALGALLDSLGIDTARNWMLQYQAKHGPDARVRIQQVTQSQDIAVAFENLLAYGNSGRLAWDWLRGVKLSSAEAASVGLPTELGQSNQMVKVLEMLGVLCQDTEPGNSVLIFMLDEVTKVEDVTDHDAINHWRNSFKLIADAQTKNIGFILSASWIDPEDFAEPLRDQQVMTRFGESHYIRLDNMDEESAKTFISALLNEWVDESARNSICNSYASEADGEMIGDGSYPFTESGLGVAAEWTVRNGGYTTPRDIQNALDEIFNRAIDEEKHIISSGYLYSQINA